VIEDFQLLEHYQVSTTCLCPLIKATKKIRHIQQRDQQHLFNYMILNLGLNIKVNCHDLFSYQMDAKKKWKVKPPKFVASCGQTLSTHVKKRVF
jgi:hypothetical protein